jgi:hypothetical protein
MAPPKNLIKNKLLLTEGADAYWFCIWACQAFQLFDIQVLDFGGINDLDLYLRQLILLSGFEDIQCIVIARDAEQNVVAAEASVKRSLSNAGLVVPAHPFEFSSGKPRIAFMFFPGYTLGSAANKKSLENGTLEHLCLQIATDKIHFPCIDQYLTCLESVGQQVKRPHKTRLHAYLAGNDDFVGLKIGEAAKVGAWDWEHPKFALFKQIMSTM